MAMAVNVSSSSTSGITNYGFSRSGVSSEPKGTIKFHSFPMIFKILSRNLRNCLMGQCGF